MGRSRIDILDGAGVTQQDLMKQLGNMGPGFFSQVVLEKHVLGTCDHVLHDPFPAVIGECDPINLRLSIPFPERICLRFPDKDEIALFGRQHHVIPIDDKHMALMIADQIGRMQVCVTEDVWP